MVPEQRMVVETIEEVIPRKILIFGANGMLGHALMDVFPNAVGMGHRDVDITERNAILSVLQREKPQVVINAAAYTNVDDCEDNRDLAFLVNGTAPGFLAEACNEVQATLVHYSTDYVFDGTKPEYRESDLPHPLSVYGQSKLAGEVAIRNEMQDYRIIRTSWLFGFHGKNFVDTILSLSRSMPIVRVVNDQIGKPTFTVDLSRKTPEIISREPGIYHITNDGICSWYEFASAFIPNVEPCSTDEFPRKAKRPAYSVLVNTKTSPLRHWKEAVREYVYEKERLS